MIANGFRVALVLVAIVGLAAAEIQNKGWWKHTVFYQIYPRSFMDSNNDGIGDLKGIISKLPHFVNAGIGAIWLSPIYKSPMKDFGYDISDFRDIHSEFGTMADFEVLTKTAKELGLKVILDLVPNHTSDEHEWFQNALKGDVTYQDYYVWVDKAKTSPPNNWLSVFSGPGWTFHESVNKWYFHQFLKEQPDLNYENAAVQEEMKNIITFWLDKGVDGFRIDAVPHLYEIQNKTIDEPLSGAPGVGNDDYAYLDHIYTKDQPATYTLVKSWKTIVDNYANEHNVDEKVLLTEAYTNLENTTKFYAWGSDVPFNFKFVTEASASSNAADFKKIIDDWLNSTKPYGGIANWVMGNHDRNRVGSRFPDRPDQMTMLAMILPGVAVTYYGEEIGMLDNMDISFEQSVDPQGCVAGPENYLERSRDPCRTPFQWDNTTNAGFSNSSTGTWLPVNKNYRDLNLEKQVDVKGSHFSVYKSLTKLRKESEVLRGDALETVVGNENKVLAVIRKGEKEAVFLVINFSNDAAQTIDLSAQVGWDAQVYAASVGSGIEENKVMNPKSIEIPAKASVVFVAKENSPGSASEMFNALGMNLILVLVTYFVLRA